MWELGLYGRLGLDGQEWMSERMSDVCWYPWCWGVVHDYGWSDGEWVSNESVKLEYSLVCVPTCVIQMLSVWIMCMIRWLKSPPNSSINGEWVLDCLVLNWYVARINDEHFKST